MDNKDESKVYRLLFSLLVMIIIIEGIGQVEAFDINSSGLIINYPTLNTTYIDSTHTKDISVNSLNATVAGAVWNNTDQSYLLNGSGGQLSFVKAGLNPYSGTISMWIKSNNDLPNDIGLFSLGEGWDGLSFIFNQNGGYTQLLSWRGYAAEGDAVGSIESGELSLNTWHHIVVSWNGTAQNKMASMHVVVNGVQETPTVGVPFNMTLGALSTTTQLVGKTWLNSNGYLNGSISNVRYYNTTKNITEMKQLYAIGRLNTGDTASVSVNYNQNLGTVANGFYGVNDHGNIYNGTYVDTNGDGTYETLSNVTWLRQKQAEAGIVTERADMSLQYHYWNVGNGGMESWIHNRTVGRTAGYTLNDTDPFVWWQLGSGGASQNCTYGASTDAHTGRYAYGVTQTNGDACYLIQQTMTFLYNGTYHLGAWVKTNSWVGITVKLVNSSWSTLKSNWTSVGAANGWTYVYVNYTVTNAPLAVKPIIDSGGDYVTDFRIDDVRILYNGADYDYFYNMDAAKEVLKHAYDNDKKVMYIISYMPTGLALVTSDCVGDYKTCSAVNNTVFANVVKRFVDNITINGQYSDALELEFWNEPDLTYFFLSNVSQDNGGAYRATLYNPMYNATRTAVKTAYPNIPFGGPAITTMTATSGGQALYRAFLNYTKNDLDFFSFHTYYNGQDADIWITNIVNQVKTDCATYGANCSRLINSEFNEQDANIMVNDSARYTGQMCTALATMINTMPNGGVQMYQFDDKNDYNVNGSLYYSEYPYRFAMLSEAGVDNVNATYYPPFYVYKNFSSRFPVGSSVKNSSTTNTGIYTSCVANGNSKTCVLINKLLIPVSTNISIAGINTIRDKDTGARYSSISNGSFTNILLNSQSQSYMDMYDCVTYSNGTAIIPTNYGTFCNDVLINITKSGNTYSIVALSGVNISLVNWSSNSPFNDIKNSSNNVILASNVNNYSISLSPNQQIEVGNFTTLNYTRNYTVSGLGTGIITLIVNITDPDSIFNNVSRILYDSSMNVLNTTSSTSLNSIISYSIVTGSYYSRIVIYTNNSLVYTSSLSSVMTIDATQVAKTCNSSYNALSELPTWLQIIAIITVVVIVMSLVFGLIKVINGDLNLPNINVDNNVLISLLIAIFLVTIISVLGILITSRLC